MLHPVLLAHLAATLLITGVVWVIQLVHYPMFKGVDAQEFDSWHNFHCRMISIIVIPLMVTEFFTAALLFPPFGFEPQIQPTMQWFLWSAFPVVIVLWALTFFVQTPMHTHLREDFSEPRVDRLVRWNWIRTGLWSLRSASCLVWLSQ